MGFGEHGAHGHSHCDSDANHSHSRYSCSKTLRLVIMLIMIFIFFLVEVIVGQITNSITLLADSFHMLSDFIALCIGLIAVRLSKRKTSKNTYGWVRAEILGALVNSVFLASLCLSIIIEAIKRFIDKHEIERVELLLSVACGGLLINIIGLVIFGHGHTHTVPTEAVEKLEEMISLSDANDGDNKIRKLEDDRECCSFLRMKNINLNIKAVFLHVLADALGSVVVIISALLNMFSSQLGIGTETIRYIDPFLCLILVSLILISTIPLFKETALILLQTVPKHVEMNKLKSDLQNIEGVVAINDLHVWNLSAEKVIASAHIVCQNLEKYIIIANEIKKVFHKHNIHSSTIQPDFLENDSLFGVESETLK